MKQVFKFREGSRIQGDPAVVAHELESIQAKRGTLTAHTVLDEARVESCALHSYFEWDDAKAAEANRLDRAGHLIRCVTVVFEQEEAPAAARQVSIEMRDEAKPPERKQSEVRAFLPVKMADGNRSYVAMSEALGDAEYRRQVLAQAHSELGSVARKYRELQELAEVVAAIDHVGQLLVDSRNDEVRQ